MGWVCFFFPLSTGSPFTCEVFHKPLEVAVEQNWLLGETSLTVGSLFHNMVGPGRV